MFTCRSRQVNKTAVPKITDYWLQAYHEVKKQKEGEEGKGSRNKAEMILQNNKDPLLEVNI
jgi:hypothetical protein